MVFGPSGELLVERGLGLRLGFVKPGFDLAGFGLDERDVNGAVVECAWQFAETAEDGRSKGFEFSERVALPTTAATVGAGAAFVSGIQQAAQFFGLGQVGVDFVQEKGGLGLVYEPKEDWGSKVFGADGSRY